MSDAACPGAETLDAFLAGALDDPARARLDAHLAHCAACREVVVLLGDDGDDRGSEAATVAAVHGDAPLRGLLAALSPGDEVGGFRVLAPLGSGGMGQVFEIERVGGGGDAPVRAALEVVRPELSVHPEAVRRFVRECALVARVDHPAFVRVLDQGTTDDGLPYFVMDLCAGRRSGGSSATRGRSTRRGSWTPSLSRGIRAWPERARSAPRRRPRGAAARARRAGSGRCTRGRRR